MAACNTPAMMEKNLGKGSQYLWIYRDAAGDYLQGAGTYRLHVPADIPAGNFWSVLVYDALSRSELQNGQSLPSVSWLQRMDFGPTVSSTSPNACRTTSIRKPEYPLRTEGQHPLPPSLVVLVIHEHSLHRDAD